MVKMKVKTAKQAADPDFVDRVFDYVRALMPELGGREDDIKRAVRAEFAGQRAYIRSREAGADHALAIEVLRLFNGRNAREIGRKLRVSKSTVYRLLKQPGRAKV